MRAATEESLRRLQTDRIDLLYTHRDDEVTPPEETLAALDELVREGKVRHVAASNVSPARLEAALAASEREGLVRYVALQPHYNLVERDYENGLADVCRRHDLGCLPYFALAKGFLTGKYRPGADGVDSQRAHGRPRLPRRARRARAGGPRRGRRRARRPGRGGEPGLAGRAAHRRRPDRQRPHARAARRADGRWPTSS